MSRKTRERRALAAVASAPSAEPQMIGGAYEGASRIARETATWYPSLRSPDREISPSKVMLDARGRDMMRNDGLTHGASMIHRDSIVGGEYRLNAQPNWKLLGLTEAWAESFQEYVENAFHLWAESPNCYPDAARVNTFTGLVRLAVGGFVPTGEVLATAEWLRRRDCPYRTAVQMVHLDRLSNPWDTDDTATLRRGVERDTYGAPIAYHIRMGHPNDSYDMSSIEWKRVPARKPWGRVQVIHIFEQMQPDQSRGVAEMVSVLKEMRMTKKFHEITLQNAVINATYAATIESELPREAAYQQLGEGGTAKWAEDYLTAIGEYVGDSKNVHIDGAKIPHLFPGTKLKLQPAGTPGGVGTGFEESLLRHIAAGLGLSYEQFSRDYTKTNYSSARASMNETWKYMQARKKVVADRFANHVYMLWLEEQFALGLVPMPQNAPNFWEGLNKEAYGECSWIGASRGQIDELKETESAILRIDRGLSTYEAECSRLGDDFRKVFAQRAREQALMRTLNLDFSPVQGGAPSQRQAQTEDPANSTSTDEAPSP